MATLLEDKFREVSSKEGHTSVQYAIHVLSGYLMNTYTDRGEGVAELVEVLTDPETNKRTIPDVAEKLRIIVKGQYKGYPVLANGNMWLPEKKTGQKMAESMGQEVTLLFLLLKWKK